MITIKKSIFSLAVSIFLTGCVTSEFSIKPDYDKKMSTLTIAGTSFDGARDMIDKTEFAHTTVGTANSSIILYTTNSENCGRIVFRKNETSPSSYFQYDIIEVFLKDSFLKKSNGKCRVTEISSLKFFDCDQPNNSVVEEYFIAEYTVHSRARDGFSEIDAISVSKKCYDLLLEKITNKAIEKGNEIKKYSF